MATLLPGAYYFTRETKPPPIAALRAAGVAMALATDCNPGTSPMTSLLLAMNMAATFFRLTVAECLAGITRNAARALGLAAETGQPRGRQALRPGDLGDRASGRAGPAHRRTGASFRTRVGGSVNEIVITPGAARLGDWRAIWRGAPMRLDPAAQAAVADGAAAVARILARGEPVYGVNTGFGKLATVRIEAGDLAALQRNIVLSHATGVGEATPTPIVRLIMALKIAGLARGASGIRPATLDLMRTMLERGLTPVIPAQGSVAASGDLAPLAHMAAAMIGVGEIEVAGVRRPAAEALDAARLAPAELGPKEGLALLNGTQFSTAHALVALFEAETAFASALATGALSTEAAKGADTPFDPRIHALRGQPGQVETAAALRALMAGSAIRASHREGDVRVQDPYCLRCQPQVMGAALDILRGAARTLAIEANGVTDNPLIFADDRRGSLRRQLPRRAGRLRRRHPRPGPVRDRLAGRAADRHAGRPGPLRACRPSSRRGQG